MKKLQVLIFMFCVFAANASNESFVRCLDNNVSSSGWIASTMLYSGAMSCVNKSEGVRNTGFYDIGILEKMSGQHIDTDNMTDTRCSSYSAQCYRAGDNKRFVHVNSRFIEWLDSTFVSNTSPSVASLAASVYSRHYAGSVRRAYQVYDIMNSEYSLNDEARYYELAYKNNTEMLDYLSSKYRETLSLFFRGDDLDLAVFDAGFWLRRTLDGSVDSVHSLLRGVLTKYDAGWYADYGKQLGNGYSSIFEYNRLFVIKVGNKTGFIHKNGEPAIAPIYDAVFNGLKYFIVVNSHGSGIIDYTGRTTVPIKYDEISDLGNGYYAVEQGSDWGLIRGDGTVVLPVKYPMLVCIGENMIGYKNLSEAGYLNMEGELDITLDESMDLINCFHNGIARVVSNSSAYYIDKNGDNVLNRKFEGIGEYNEGLADAVLNGKSGYVNNRGNTVIPMKYELAVRFSEGLASVRLKDKWGFIDKSGNMVIQPQYDNEGYFDDGLADVSKNGVYGYINKAGQTVIPFKYSSASPFSYGLAAVGVGNKCGYINKNGDMVIPPVYNDCYPFIHGLAEVKIGNNDGYIDKTGAVVARAAVKCKKNVLLNGSGKIIWPNNLSCK